MSGAFVGTGLAGPLADAADALGWDAPTQLQAAAIPVIRRGGNVVLRGSTGAGVTAAWAAGVLERLPSLPEGPGPRALVLCPTADRAGHVADVLARMVSHAPGEEGEPWRALRIRAAAPGWVAGGADLLVTDPASAARAVGGARLKLDGTGILVLEDLPALLELAGDALATVFAALPRDAQRVFVTPERAESLDEFIEANARRALTIPPRPQEPAGTPAQPTHTVTVILTREADKLDALCSVLGERDAAEDVVLVRSRARAADLARALERRGFGPSAGGPALESWTGDARGTVAFDVPFDASGLARLAGDAPVVLATPAERRHLHALAREAGIGVEMRSPRAPRTGIGEWLGGVERALDEEDLDAQIALLQPLFERHAAHEVAAALSALLRRRTPEPQREPAARRPREPDAPPSFVRLFFGIGQRDGLRPADLVGAITGETGLPGSTIGRIDIRDTFTVAEVDTAAADRVIRALNGTTLRGRSMRVDYDRRSTPGAVRRSRPPRPGS